MKDGRLRAHRAVGSYPVIRWFSSRVLTQMGNCLAEEGAFYIPAVCYNFLEKLEPRGGLKRIHSRIKL
jgi:hypothetical protein